jgi:hypothetical protein
MGKMRFWLSYAGVRGNSHEAGLEAGRAVHARGWDAGVKVTPGGANSPTDPGDAFQVHMTTGSHVTGHDTHLGTVRDTPDGPRWDPADKPGTIPARVRGMEVVAAIPVRAHRNEVSPAEYLCTVISGFYGSGTPRFAAVHAYRDSAGAWACDTNRYDLPGTSQSGAVHEMIRLAGCERPAPASK